MIELIHNHPIDFEILKKLYHDWNDLQQAWPGAKYPLCIEEWTDFFKTSSGYASLLFKYKETFIGHLILKPHDEKQLYICFVILDKKFRGQGLIYDMLRLTEQFALANFKYDALWLHVDPQNIPAIKAYKKFGFQLVRITETGKCQMSKRLIRDGFNDGGSNIL